MAPDPRGRDRRAPGGGALTARQTEAALRELARLHGIQESYVDLRGRRRRAASGPLIAVLRAMGSPVESPADVPGALRDRREELARRIAEPVTVAWDGGPAAVVLSLPSKRPPDRLDCALELEGGEVRSWGVDVASLPAVDGRTVELALPGPLPPGYHGLEVDLGGRTATTLVISAPGRAAHAPPGAWGVFAPVYALHRNGGWGVGDLSDLATLLSSVRGVGGGLVGTLPLYAAFLRDRVEPSPYSPVSRLFWNELFLDVEGLLGTADPELRALVDSSEVRGELRSLRAGELVDLGGAMALKRRILEAAARSLEAGPGRRDALESFARDRPGLDDYARFRAAGERWGANWRTWPGPPRDGRLDDADVDPRAAAYHRYVQWAAEEQLAALARSAGSSGGLYLDLPLGVHPDGYDAWRQRDAFVADVSAGAPPDDFFTGGQDWGFPPPHPERIRSEGYRYQVACVRHAMRYAAAVRLDHVMGLHRLYWVPHGIPADRGVYVRYRPEEWYAILTLESRRAGTAVIGEDLGTVPRPVRASMRRRGLLRSHVVQMEVDPLRTPPVREPPADSLASLNTHDMPPFAAWWGGLDIGERLASGLLAEAEAGAERERRARIREALADHLRGEGLLQAGAVDGPAVLSACLAALASSPAGIVMVSLEDLWGETRAQNLPGVPDRPSWRRRMAYPLEAALGLPEVAGRLRLVGTLRRDAASAGRNEGPKPRR